LGITQEELAGRSGLHRTYITDIERDARNPSLESIHKLAEALDVSMSTLFGQNDNARLLGLDDDASAGSLGVEILLVEDEMTDAHMAMSALRKARLSNRIHHVTDGESALAYLFGSNAKNDPLPGHTPGVILLDLNLPRMDGRDLLRILKTDERTRAIPVVILTVSDQSRDIDICLQLGAEAYMVKPVDILRLVRITPQLNYHWTLFASTNRGK